MQRPVSASLEIFRFLGMTTFGPTRDVEGSDHLLNSSPTIGSPLFDSCLVIPAAIRHTFSTLGISTRLGCNWLEACTTDRPQDRELGPLLHSLRQRQPPPQVAQVVCDHAQPHLVRPEPMATQPRRLSCLLAFLDPRHGRAP